MSAILVEQSQKQQQQQQSQPYRISAESVTSILGIIRGELVSILNNLATTKKIIKNEDVEDIVDQALYHSRLYETVHEVFNPNLPSCCLSRISCELNLEEIPANEEKRDSKFMQDIARKIVFERIDNLDLPTERAATSTSSSMGSQIKLLPPPALPTATANIKTEEMLSPQQEDSEESSKSDLTVIERYDKRLVQQKQQQQHGHEVEMTPGDGATKMKEQQSEKRKKEILSSTRETIRFMLDAKNLVNVIGHSLNENENSIRNHRNNNHNECGDGQKNNSIYMGIEKMRNFENNKRDAFTTMEKNVKKSTDHLLENVTIRNSSLTRGRIPTTNAWKPRTEKSQRGGGVGGGGGGVGGSGSGGSKGSQASKKAQLAQLQEEIIANDYFAVLLDEIRELLKSAQTLHLKSSDAEALTTRDFDEARRKIIQMEVVRNTLLMRKFRFFGNILNALEMNIECMKGIVALNAEKDPMKNRSPTQQTLQNKEEINRTKKSTRSFIPRPMQGAFSIAGGGAAATTPTTTTTTSTSPGSSGKPMHATTKAMQKTSTKGPYPLTNTFSVQLRNLRSTKYIPEEQLLAMKYGRRFKYSRRDSRSKKSQNQKTEMSTTRGGATPSPTSFSPKKTNSPIQPPTISTATTTLTNGNIDRRWKKVKALVETNASGIAKKFKKPSVDHNLLGVKNSRPQKKFKRHNCDYPTTTTTTTTNRQIPDKLMTFNSPAEQQQHPAKKWELLTWNNPNNLAHVASVEELNGETSSLPPPPPPAPSLSSRNKQSSGYNSNNNNNNNNNNGKKTSSYDSHMKRRLADSNI